MKRLGALLAVVAAIGMMTVTPTTFAAGSGSSSTVGAIEHAQSDTTTDTGKHGDSPGDILTFANPLFNGADKAKIGTDQGFCIRVVVGKSYECTWTNFLPGGQIVVQGPFYDSKPSRLAITGGTGKYADAQGEMSLSELPGGTAYKFVFHLR